MLHERLRRARILKGLSLQQLADHLGDISKQALSRYEKGKDTPGSTRLIQLAKALDVQPEFFFRNDHVQLGEVDFRKHAAFGKRRQESIKERVREHLERYFAIERCFESGPSSPKFSRWYRTYAVSSPEAAENAAIALRADWKLGVQPIANLTETLEEHGIKVVGLKAEGQFDGLCALVNDGDDAVIVINTARPGERQRFTLAHELGHLVMGLPESVLDSREEEHWCNRFASALLFPAEQVLETFGQHRRRIVLREYLLAKREWGISMETLLQRLFELGVIPESYHRSTLRLWTTKGFLRREPDPLPGEGAHRMEQLVCRALAEGIITPSRGAELLNLTASDMESVLANGMDKEGMDASQGTYL